jgi:hypothetical protein
LFVVAVAGVMGLAVFVVRKQETTLRQDDDAVGCTTYASVPGEALGLGDGASGSDASASSGAPGGS